MPAIPVELIVGGILSLVEAHAAAEQKRADAEQEIVLKRAREAVEHKDSLRALAELCGVDVPGDVGGG